jgi:preprotein translocase subunit SecE
MAKPKAPTSGARLRTPPPRPAVSGTVAARAEQHAPKKKIDLVQFGREVRVEARRITWPSRRETWITTVMVLIMVVVMGIFFLATDSILSWAVQLFLKIPDLVS